MYVPVQRPFIFEGWPSWPQHLCLPFDERMRSGYSASQGSLSGNGYIETFLQGLLLFGPSVFLLIGAPIRILQLYHAKLVIVPNYRGLVKVVSKPWKLDGSDTISDIILGFIFYSLCFAAGLCCQGNRRNSQRYVVGDTLAILSCLYCTLRAVIFRTWPFCCAFYPLDRLSRLFSLRRCGSGRSTVRSKESMQPIIPRSHHFHSKACSLCLRST
jgi:hypothetical protein